MYGGLIALRVLARKYEFKADVSAGTCFAWSSRQQQQHTHMQTCLTT